jgi:hypothetical protein
MGAAWTRCIQSALSREIRMKVVARIMGRSLILFLIGCPVLMSARSPDQQQNVFACSNGWDSCDSSALTQADKSAVANAKQEQNISDCENSWASCNRFTLTTPELTKVGIAVHQKLVSDCWSGIGPCDYFKLTASEAASLAICRQREEYL